MTILTEFSIFLPEVSVRPKCLGYDRTKLVISMVIILKIIKVIFRYRRNIVMRKSL